MRKIVFLFLFASFAINQTFAEEPDIEKLAIEKARYDEYISTQPTEKLERRLEEIDDRISELETEAEFFRTEPPALAVSSPAKMEKTGFYIDEEQRQSKLLNPTVEETTKKSINELKRLKEGIEGELDRRYMEER